MHILVIPSWYSSPQDPVTGVFIREQAAALHQAGHQVGVLVPPRLRSKRGLLNIRSINELKLKITHSIEYGLPTYRSAGWGWFPALYPDGNRSLLVRGGMNAFKAYQKEFGKPDILHAHSAFYGGYLAAQIAEPASIPVVLTEHSSAFLKRSLPEKQVTTLQRTLHVYRRIIVPSEAQAGAFSHYYPGTSLTVLPNGVDPDFFTPAEVVPPMEPFRFAAIGSLETVKGYHVLLSAFSQVFKSEPVKLQIAGNGSQLAVLRDQSVRTGIHRQVEFLGSLQRPEIRDLLQRSHSLVSASLAETFGIALIEAGSCGLPVVATRCGGPEEIVRDLNGYLVQPGSASSLATGMVQMVERYHSFDRGAIRADCEERFSLHAQIKKLEQIYREVIDG